MERIRTLMIAGVLVIVPAVITVYAVWMIMNGADKVFGDGVQRWLLLFYPLRDGADPAKRVDIVLVRHLVSLFLALILIMFVGWLSTFFLVKRVIHFGERIVSRLPVIKFFYNTPKEVLNTFAQSDRKSFKRVVMIEYPKERSWVLAFATGEIIRKPENTHMIAVFVPTTPNPTSGFLLFIPADDVYDTNIPVEQGARMIISGGILSPDFVHTQRFAGMESEPAMPALGPLSAEPSYSGSQIAVSQIPPTEVNESTEKKS